MTITTEGTHKAKLTFELVEVDAETFATLLGFADPQAEAAPTVDTLEALESLGLGAKVRDQSGYVFELVGRDAWKRVATEEATGRGWPKSAEEEGYVTRTAAALAVDLKARHLGPAFDVLSEGASIAIEAHAKVGHVHQVVEGGSGVESTYVGDIAGLAALPMGSVVTGTRSQSTFVKGPHTFVGVWNIGELRGGHGFAASALIDGGRHHGGFVVDHLPV